jgi:head-tail adaptor
VHSRLADSWADVGWYDTRVSFETNTPTRSSTGMDVEGWAPVLSLQNLAARLAANDGQGTGATHGREHRTRDGDWVEHTHIIGLASHQPLVDETMRARIEGVTDRVFDVVAVVADSDRAGTNVYCRSVDETGSDRDG